MADLYESNLRKPITSIGDFKGRASFPSHWPTSLSHLELVVESWVWRITKERGLYLCSCWFNHPPVIRDHWCCLQRARLLFPLPVLPFSSSISSQTKWTKLVVNWSSTKGIFIITLLLISFVLLHFLIFALFLRCEVKSFCVFDAHFREKYEEKDLHSRCLKELGLFALEKADNITPSLMIDCLSRLLSRAEELYPVLTGTHVWITTYYSVQSDGEICIPWNWK